MIYIIVIKFVADKNLDTREDLPQIGGKSRIAFGFFPQNLQQRPKTFL